MELQLLESVKRVPNRSLSRNTTRAVIDVEVGTAALSNPDGPVKSSVKCVTKTVLSFYYNRSQRTTLTFLYAVRVSHPDRAEIKRVLK